MQIFIKLYFHKLLLCSVRFLEREVRTPALENGVFKACEVVLYLHFNLELCLQKPREDGNPEGKRQTNPLTSL